MTDLAARLKNWRSVHLARLHLLMEEAADEMERLSANGDCPVADNAANRDNTPAVNATPSEGIEQSECTLTDAEREAVEYFARDNWAMSPVLRGLLERL